jgi:hypothetical protein
MRCVKLIWNDPAASFLLEGVIVMQPLLRASWVRRSFWLTAAVLALLLLPGTLRAQDDVVRPAQSDPAWQGEYFTNATLAGTPALVRADADISFRWGNAAPAPDFPNDRFSVRWTRYVYFPSDGVYRFSLASDDGSRLFIDDQMVIDAWYDHTAKTFVVDRTLRAGHHLLRAEYYDNIGDAQIQVTWKAISQQEPASSDWRGEYFNNRALLGDPVLTRTDQAIDFDWGTGSPQPGVVNSDNFSVRWTRTLTLPNGVYRFRATVDDGVRIYANNRLVLDQWREGAAATFESADVQLSGRTALRVEYFDSDNEASIQVVYTRGSAPSPTPAVSDAWKGEYFNNPTLDGQPALVRNDANVDFNWGLAAPADGVNSDDFSVRWTRTLNFQPGNYRFRVVVDDGVRLWVNNALLIDQWRQASATEFTSDIYLPGGSLPVRLEFVEYRENALIQLTWSLIGGGSDSGGGGGESQGETVTEFKPRTRWVGEYFNNADLAGSPVFARDDSQIDFDWGAGSPREDLPADNFSVRWTNTIAFESGLYRFTTETDDGVRLYVDGRLLIDKWRQQPATRYSADLQLSRGNHTVRMEYQERGDLAIARLHIDAVRQGTASVANLITCVPPQPDNYAWIRLYRLDASNRWVAVSRGIGSINPTGYLKIDGLPVDTNRFGSTGEPYKIEQWIDGRVVRSTGDFLKGEAEFRMKPFVDNTTPWGC